MTDYIGTSIQIEQLSKSFGDTAVLTNINLDVKSGEFIAIVGKSGCGKSTLLRLIANLEQKTTGSLLLNKQGVADQADGTRVLFQEPRLLPWKSVLENISICATNKAPDAVLATLKSVGLEQKAAEWPNKLSGGQRQRVALARALSTNPRLLLLDEPLGALDALTRLDMQALIESLWQQSGFTALLVTHDVSEAVSLADRVILIEEGAITLDLPIPLARPRIRNNDFVYYESKILNRVMGYAEDSVQTPEFAI
ncbi:MAG: ATP-binding cassette domain-containing protein [Solibacillus sp.]